jgi:hypothetical protein
MVMDIGDYRSGMMVKDIYNIYMTFPSDVKTSIDKTNGVERANVSVSTADGLALNGEFGEILTTSETAIKYLFKKKIEEEKDLDFTLDQVFLLLSDRVKGKVGFSPQISENRPAFNVNTTHLDVLCHQMDRFYKDCFDKAIVPSFSEVTVEIPCGNSLDDTKQLGDNIICLCEAIVAYKEQLPANSKIKLYIDTTGGFRNAAMLFLIVGRIMSYLGIEIANIFYTSWNKGKCTVHEIKDIYDLLDLIAGFEEFLMFGSAKKLNDYCKLDGLVKAVDSKKPNQKSIDDLIKAMNRFSDVINISRRGEFKTELSYLAERLSKIRFNQDLSAEDFNYQLIKFLREPIEKEYTSLFEPKMLNINDDLSYVEWCLKHDYVQQALTLFKECVPTVLIEKGIIEVDKEQFNKHLQDENLKAEKKILENAFERWKAKYPKRNTDQLFKFKEFFSVYADNAEYEADVCDDSDLVFVEINKSRLNYIEKYTSKDKLHTLLEDIIRGRVKEIHDTEYKLRKEYKNENERKEKLEIELSRIKDNLLSDLFEKIASYKLVPSKDSSSKLQKIIDFLVAVFMNANNITDINNLPIKLREMLLNGNKGKLEPYLSNADTYQFSFTGGGYESLRPAFCNIMKSHIRRDILFSDISKGFLLKEYDFKREAQDIYNEYNIALYNISGVTISSRSEESLAKVIEVLAYYFEIKKSRNDSNHARIEESSQFSTSSEIKSAINRSINLIRELTE